MPLFVDFYNERLARSSRPDLIKIRKAPIMLYPLGAEHEYTSELLRYTNDMYRLTLDVLPEIKQLLADYRVIRGDDISDNISELYLKARVGLDELYTDDDLALMASKTADRVSDFNRVQVRKMIAGMAGVDVFTSEPWLGTQLNLFTKNNVGLIKSISGRYFGEIEEITYRYFSQGLRWEGLRKEIRKRYQVSRSRAKLIARDQVGKLNGQLTELRQKDLGINKYRWRTAMDERVRPSHSTKEGRIFEWSKPPADTGHPGWDYQCRCYAEPILKGLI